MLDAYEWVMPLVFLLVVADVEREGDDVPGDVGREARERLRRKFRSERLSMGLLVRWEADRADLLQVRVSGVGERGRKRRASGEKHPVNCAPTADNSPLKRMMFLSGALQRGLVLWVTKVDIRSGSSRE